MKLTTDGKMTIAAHRGDSYNYYENTMEAFRAAIRSGVEMIETDVHLTKDDQLVLIHDNTVERTTDGRGWIKDMTLAELRKLNAGGSEEWLSIPTLEELLQLLKESGTLLNLELKEYYEGDEVSLERCHRCIDLCVELIEKYDMADKMVFNSFDAHALEYIAETYPGKYLLHGFYPYNKMRNVKRNPDEYLYCACIWGEPRNREYYEYLASKGIEAWIGASITGAGLLGDCFKLGARLVTTNYPGDCREKLESIGAR